MYKPPWKRKLNNRGSSMVVVLAILSLLALMGATAASAALVNVQLRSMNRLSDQDFYQVETIWDEIYEELGQRVSAQLRDAYAQTLENLYKSGYDTNSAANAQMYTLFDTKLLNMTGLNTVQFQSDGTISTDDKAAACLQAAAYLKELAGETWQTGLNIRVGDISQVSEVLGAVAQGSSQTSFAKGILLNDVTITYVDEKKVSASITMDLEISAPNIRFIDGTNLLSDYVMIANGDVVVDGVGPIDPNCVNIVGSLRGSNIQIQDGSRVAMDSDRIIAQNSLELGNSGKLSIGKDWFDENEEDNSLSAAQGRASVWATDLKLSGSSADLETKDTDLNIRDDLTIVRDQNIVRLSGGNYYGYGNEGSGGHQNSSAILVNGKNNRLELALDSLTLAGHSWLKFADSSESSYKMAESIAQKSTQTMYLVPADQMTVTVEDASRQATNPIILAEGQTSFSLEVKLDGNTYKYKNIPVNTLASSGLADAGTWAAENSENTSASGKILLGLYNSRVYVFYNFSGTDADAQRKAFFKAFLENQEDSFNAMLQKSGWGESGSGEVNDAPGIYISTSENNIASAGSIYKMSTGSGTALYQLIEDPDATSTERTVSRINRLTGSFQNLSSYLTESGARGSSRSLLPAGQYIDPSVIRAQDQAIQTMNDGKLVVAKGDYELKLSAAKPVEGLIIAGGKVTVSGNGIFRGLIISFGMNADGTQGTGGIELSGNNMTLIADSGVVQECITGAVAEEKSAYFYDYGENAPSVLNDYEYFILESNWTRGNSGASQ